MQAKEKLYLNSARTSLVREGDPAAAFLYATPGDEIPQSAVDKFGLVDGKLPKGKARTETILLGSSALPGAVLIVPGKTVPLGNVVARAHKASGLTVDDWNALSETEREARLVKTIEDWRAEASAKPKPAAKPKVADKEQKAGESKAD